MAASDDVKKLKELIDNPSVKAGGQAQYKNKSYGLSELNVLLKAAQKVAKQEADSRMVQSGKEFETQVNLELKTGREESALKEKTIRARINLEAELANLSLALENDGDIPKAQTAVRDAYLVLQGLNPKDKLLKGVTIPAATVGVSEREGLPQTGAAKSSFVGKEDLTTTVKSKVPVVKGGNNVEVTTYMDGRVTEKILGPSTLPDTAPSSIPKGTAGTPSSMKTYVDAQLKAKGLADTPANRKTLRAEYQALPQAEKGKAAAPAATDNSWEQLFIKNNPAKAWYLTDLDRNKYPQLFAVIQEYAKDRPLTIEEKNAYDAKLEGTDFFRELSTSGKVREIKNVVGDLGFDSTDFTQFVHTAINMGYTGDRLKQETYKEVFKTGADGKYVNPTALARATKSADYLNVVNDARAYFNTAGADQASVQSILTGGITREDFQRQQREIAKKRYPHLADLIDQGVSLESLAGNFKNTAAELLEVDPNTLDMSAADYEVAINFGEEGKKRVMSTGEWDRLLRTDPKYKWEYTENAKDEARGLAANLVKAFGRII
jgi:hypothetical protein